MSPHLEVQAVLEGGRVTEGDFLVGLLLAYAVLLLEGIETGDGEGDVRQREGVAGVAGILVVQGVDRQAHLAVPVPGIGDGGGDLVLQGLVHRARVVPAVTMPTATPM